MTVVGQSPDKPLPNGLWAGLQDFNPCVLHLFVAILTALFRQIPLVAGKYLGFPLYRKFWYDP